MALNPTTGNKRSTGQASGNNQLQRYSGTLFNQLKNAANTTYQPKNALLTSISTLTGSTGLLFDTAGTATAVNLSGDATSSGSVLTLATVNANVGTFGDSTHVPQITVNAKGLITAVTNVALTAPGINPNVYSKSATYTESNLSGFNVALCDATSGAITANLPTAATGLGIYTIKKVDSSAHNVTITPNGSEKIDGASTVVISTQYDSYTLVSNGSSWSLI